MSHVALTGRDEMSTPRDGRMAARGIMQPVSSM
jgi:hypothetical protein